jgi:ribosomal protein S18 acetylase RimI-like enzyme
VESTVIRTATLEDLPVIRRLFEESVYEGQTRINDTGADIDNFAEAYPVDSEKNAFWVAERNDEIVGMIGVQEVRDDVAEVRRLRVDGAQRRRGIGTALMEQALTFCRDHSYVKIVLDVRIERSPAIEMFNAFGFFHSRTREQDGHKMLEFYVDLYQDPHG